MDQYCYLCGEPKTSAEHVPARCFFPKDSEFRKDLIKVPSCARHNEATSMDDEYVRNIICMSIGTNPIAFRQFIEEVQKSFEHSIKLQQSTFQNTQKVYVEGREGIQTTFAFEIDRNRFDKVMKKIGYALYYHKYNKVWQRGLIVATDCLLNVGMQQDENGQLISLYRQLMIEPIFDGKNPKVFQYKFQETECEDVILWMKFYEGFEVFIIPNTNTSRPEEI